MDSALQLSLWFFGLWALAVVIAMFVAKRRKPEPIFAPNTFWRLRTERGTLRARFIGEDSRGYRIEAPMAQGSYVALRSGDAVYVEAPGFGEAFTFRTQVLDRDAKTRIITLKRAKSPISHNRRDETRIKTEQRITLNGVPSVLLDQSAGGAKVLTSADLATGDTVRLESATEPTRMAYALEVLPDTLDGRLASCVRLIFADQMG